MPSFVGFTEVESHMVTMLLVQLLNDVESSLTQGLTDGIKEHKDKVCHVPCSLVEEINDNYIDYKSSVVAYWAIWNTKGIL